MIVKCSETLLYLCMIHSYLIMSGVGKTELFCFQLCNYNLNYPIISTFVKCFHILDREGELHVLMKYLHISYYLFIRLCLVYGIKFYSQYSSGTRERPGGGGTEKHYIYAAALGGHLYCSLTFVMTYYFDRAGVDHGPPLPLICYCNNQIIA